MPFDGVEINEAAARLMKAKELIRTQGWCPDGEGEPGGPRCVVAAIALCDLSGSAWPALLAFADAIGIKTNISLGTEIGDWNDSPRRTLDEINAAFDRAIAFTLVR